MELTHEDVLGILELLERSSVEYLEVEVGGTRLVADRSGSSIADARVAAKDLAREQRSTAATLPAGGRQRVSDDASDAGDTAVAQEDSDDRATEEGLVTVCAPVVGVFYRASEPGAPPFVEIGSRIEAGTTLGLVEVMKTFNSVTADVPGTIAEILVENEAFVEHGQPLLTIRAE